MCVSLIVDCDSEQSGARNRDEDAGKGKQRNEAETHRESEGAEGVLESEGAECAFESQSRSVIDCRVFDPNAGLSLFQPGVPEVREAKRKAAQARHLQPCHAFAKEVRCLMQKEFPHRDSNPGRRGENPLS